MPGAGSGSLANRITGGSAAAGDDSTAGREIR
jgi:hypothetical protein